MIRMGETIVVPCSSGTQPPRAVAPAGSVDCHMHIFDPRFPFVEGRTPDIGTLDEYKLFQRRMGLDRCIVVAPSSYGLDNRCLLDALARLGDTARGVATIDESFTEKQLEELHAAGCRGIRYNYGRVKGTNAEGIRRLAEKIAPLNWHFQLHMPNANDLVENEVLLEKFPVTLVIDHMGRAPQPGGLSHPVVNVILRQIAKGNTYVKLSFFYETDTAKLVDYGHLVHHLAHAAPDRCIWGSDWNHANKVVKPDDAHQFDKLAEWIGDEAIRHKVLVDNPHTLYWRP